MRVWWAGVAAIAIGCGGREPPPAQNKGPPAAEQVTLAITTSGDGAVHGDAECRGACTQRFAKGSKLALQAVADSGAKFDGWGGACGGDTCALTLDADAAVTATFTRPPPPKPQHRLAVSLSGNGSVRSAPSGIDCGATCLASYDEGMQVALTPAPGPGFAFSGWSGACNGADGCVVMMNGDASVSARFDPLPPQMFSVTVNVAGPGRIAGSGIDCPGTACTAQIAAGTLLSLTAAANGGARLTAWGGACAGSGAVCSVLVGQNLSVGASFDNEVLVLAAADGTNSNALAINSTSVFYARYGNNVYGLWSVPKAGGTPMLVNSDSCCFNTIVADDNYVYWTNWDAIYRAPAAGGSSKQLFRAGGVREIAVDGDRVFWAQQAGWYGFTAGIYVGSVSAATVTALVTTSALPSGGIAIDAQNVWWTDQHGIGRVPRSGGPSDMPIQCGTCIPLTVKVDFDNVYVRNFDGETWSRAKAGGDFHQLDAGNPRGNFIFQPVELDVNAKVAYWTWRDAGGGGNQGLFRANADGSGWTALEKSADTYWSGPRVDDKYIFYFHAGALYRRLK